MAAPKVTVNGTARKDDKSEATAKVAKAESGFSVSVLDIGRLIVLLLFALGGLSYYTTAGESILFNKRPWFTRPDVVKQYLKGELLLTPAELAKYDGTDPSLPVYLALNGTIYDVSAGRRTYGPGGSYHYFAGRDATRGYVTGCFAQDTTGDLRGVEEMFIPIDDPDDEREKSLTSAQRKTRKEKERRDAKKRVKQEVEKWEKFYTNSKKYFQVGRVVAQEYTGDIPELCAEAQKARPKRKMKVKDEI